MTTILKESSQLHEVYHPFGLEPPIMVSVDPYVDAVTIVSTATPAIGVFDFKRLKDELDSALSLRLYTIKSKQKPQDAPYLTFHSPSGKGVLVIQSRRELNINKLAREKALPETAQKEMASHGNMHNAWSASEDVVKPTLGKMIDIFLSGEERRCENLLSLALRLMPEKSFSLNTKLESFEVNFDRVLHPSEATNITALATRVFAEHFQGFSIRELNSLNGAQGLFKDCQGKMRFVFYLKKLLTEDEQESLIGRFEIKFHADEIKRIKESLTAQYIPDTSELAKLLVFEAAKIYSRAFADSKPLRENKLDREFARERLIALAPRHMGPVVLAELESGNGRARVPVSEGRLYRAFKKLELHGITIRDPQDRRYFVLNDAWKSAVQDSGIGVRVFDHIVRESESE